MATRSALALLLLLALAAFGCGGEDEDPVEGTGYTYSVPDGWEDVSDRAEEELGGQLGGLTPDSVVVGENQDDFATNVNVIREGGVPTQVTAEQYAEVSLAALRDPAAAGFPPPIAEAIERLRPTQITELREAELDGEQAFEWDYRSSQEGRRLRVRQVATVMGGAGYTVTLTALPDGFEEGNDALDEVVESWSWE
jgi:PsbP